MSDRMTKKQGPIIAVCQTPLTINIPSQVGFDEKSATCSVVAPMSVGRSPKEDLTADPRGGHHIMSSQVNRIILARGVNFLATHATVWRLSQAGLHDPNARSKGLPTQDVVAKSTIPWATVYRDSDGKLDTDEIERRLFAAMEWARTDTKWSKVGPWFRSQRTNRVPKVALFRLASSGSGGRGDIVSLGAALDCERAEVLDVITVQGAGNARVTNTYQHLGAFHDWCLTHRRGDLAQRCRIRGQHFKKAA